MKKILFSVLVLGMMVGSANAGVLTFVWASNEASTTIDIAPGDSETINIYYTTEDGSFGISEFNTLFYANEAVSNVSQTGTSANLANWGNGSVNGVLGAIGQQLAFAANSNADAATGAASTTMLLGTQTLTLDSDDGSGVDLEIVWDTGSLGVLANDGAGVQDYGLADGWGVSYPSYISFINHDPGFAGSKTLPARNRAVLFIHQVPEPASLALLAIGGIALLRRR